MFTRQKLLKHQCTENVTDIVFFIVYKIFFLFILIEALDSKGIIKFPKKSITSATECSFHFRYVTNKILPTLGIYFARSGGHKFICYLRVFVVGLGR